MTIMIGRRVTALGLAGVLAFAAIVPAAAAPISGNAALVSALPDHTTQVRWRRGWGWAGAGVAAGIAAGAIIASRPYGYPYPYYGYGPGYPYGPAPVYMEPEPVYVAPPAPVYAAPQPLPNYGMRQCWVVRNADQNVGYWVPC